MAVAIRIGNFDQNAFDDIKSSLTLKYKISEKKYEEEIFYATTDTVAFIPYRYARDYLKFIPDKINRYVEMLTNRDLSDRINSNDIDTSSEEYRCCKLRNNQLEVFRRAFNFLTEKGSCILALHCGFGKSITALHLAQRLRYRTCIVVNKLVLMDQWKSSIAQFFPRNSCQIIAKQDRDGTSVGMINADFCIVNAINICKYSSSFWKSIGTLIVDELHNVVTPVLSKGLLRITPRYIIGLSATPTRYDEFNSVIPWFFGDDCVIRKPLEHHHLVYVVKTGFVPVIKSVNGKLDWNAILTSQACDDSRNRLIVETIMSFPRTRVWIVLVKRIVQADNLVKIFYERNVNVATLTGTRIHFDRSCNVLIGTCSKIGVGFDHAAVDSLCVAADVERYFVQFIGRCMRRIDVEPIIVDFVDSFCALQKHFQVRRKEYENAGGEIREL